MPTARVMTLIGSILLIGGALLPWGTVSMGMISRSVSGMSGNGLISFGIGVITLIGTLAKKGLPAKYYAPWISLLSLIALLILSSTIYKLLQLVIIENPSGGIEIGSGLWVSFLGSVLATLGGIMTIPAIPEETKTI